MKVRFKIGLTNYFSFPLVVIGFKIEFELTKKQLDFLNNITNKNLLTSRPITAYAGSKMHILIG